MILAFKILLFLCLILFGMATFGEENAQKQQTFGGLMAVSILTLLITFLFIR